MSRETALRLIAAMAARLSVEIDVAAELDAAQTQFAASGGHALDGVAV
ncbi:MAG TPA: hypothetical protein VFN13_08145 [Rudaea sp.]|nr:hypothetical protein [Rudaea sp.]